MCVFVCMYVRVCERVKGNGNENQRQREGERERERESKLNEHNKKGKPSTNASSGTLDAPV